MPVIAFFKNSQEIHQYCVIFIEWNLEAVIEFLYVENPTTHPLLLLQLVAFGQPRPIFIVTTVRTNTHQAIHNNDKPTVRREREREREKKKTIPVSK